MIAKIMRANGYPKVGVLCIRAVSFSAIIKLWKESNLL